MRRLALGVFAAVVLAGATACDGEGLIGVPEIDGTYTLRSANGDDVPAVLYQDPSVLVELVSGSITLDDDGSFTATHALRETESDGTSTSYAADCSGTYSQLGGVITFLEAEANLCGGTYEATLSGSTLTIAYDAELEAVYSR